jgi:hypothetical protein
MTVKRKAAVRPTLLSVAVPYAEGSVATKACYGEGRARFSASGSVNGNAQISQRRSTGFGTGASQGQPGLLDARPQATRLAGPW